MALNKAAGDNKKNFPMRNIKKQENVLKSLKTAKFGKTLFFLIFGILLLSTFNCANIQQPMGGPRDSIPPKILAQQPQNLKTNFQDRKIVITFDEFIRLNNPNKEVSISPDMESSPKITAKRKQLEIELPETLEENTTYVMNFGKAIVDNNEGNPLENFIYVFSTGDKIDSLSISGRVINGYTNEPEIQLSVLLIPIAQDSIFGKKKANIFTSTDSSGNFKLNYLRPDTYKIYALKEQNNDRIFNSPDEWIGFLQDSIVLKNDTTGIQLITFKETPEQFKIQDRNLDQRGILGLKFNQHLFQPRIEITYPDSLDNKKITLYNKTKDSAYVWLPSLTFDSIKVKVYEGQTLLDSTLLRRPSGDKYNRNIFLASNLGSNKVNKIKHVQLFSSYPISTVDKGKIKLTEDSLDVVNYQLARDSADSRNITLRYNWKAKKNYELTFDEGAVNSSFGDKNEKISFKFTLDETDRFGDLSLNVQLPDSGQQYIVELIDELGAKILEKRLITEQQKISFVNILEGKYRIRIIYDTNKNGIWDSGKIKEKRLPEKIWYYEKTFNIRPNWEQEETIKIPSIDAPQQILPPPNRNR